MDHNPAGGFDVAGEDQQFQAWGPCEGVLGLAPEGAVAGAGASAATVPSTLGGVTMWSPPTTEASLDSMEPTPQSQFEDLFSPTVSPRPSTAASSLVAQRPSAEEVLFPGINPSAWAQDELLQGPIGPAVRDNGIYPPLFQGSPMLACPMPHGLDTQIPQAGYAPVWPGDGYLQAPSNFQDSFASSMPANQSTALLLNGATAVAPLVPMPCPFSGDPIILSGLAPIPAPACGYPPQFVQSAKHSWTWPTNWDPGMAHGGVMNPADRSSNQYPPIQNSPGGSSVPSLGSGAIPIHADVSGTGHELCHCPHTHEQHTSQPAETPSSPKPTPGARKKRKREVDKETTAEGSPPKKPARERRKEERPDKCEICGMGFQYPRELRKHIAAQHKDDAHLYGVSTARHPCTFPGCAKDFARSDHLTRHRKEKNHWS